MDPRFLGGINDLKKGIDSTVIHKYTASWPSAYNYLMRLPNCGWHSYPLASLLL
jgi:hypothetical protein